MSEQEQLKKEVLDLGLCSSCGMCTGLCPYFMNVDGQIRVIHSCKVEKATCYRVCPKNALDIQAMDCTVFHKTRQDQALGVLKAIYFGRGQLKDRARVQYGGVTTALVGLAMEEGLISAAVLTGGNITAPRPVLAQTVEEVYRCAGSKYTAVPTLMEFNRAVKDGYRNLGVVGRPCQITALRKMEQAGYPELPDTGENPVVLTLGLFCFWSLAPEFYQFISREMGNEEIIKMDIPLEGPVLETKNGLKRYSLDQIRPFIKKSCQFCFDPTAEWADIAIGATESDPSWNTLVVRSEKGQELVDLALEKGLIEIMDYPVKRLPLLRKAVLNKKMRVLDMLETEGQKSARPQFSQEYRQELEKQWGGVNQ